MYTSFMADVALEHGSNGARVTPLQALREKLETQAAVIGVVGLGYVGLPLAMAYAGRTFRVTGIDVSTERVLTL